MGYAFFPAALVMETREVFRHVPGRGGRRFSNRVEVGFDETADAFFTLP